MVLVETNIENQMNIIDLLYQTCHLEFVLRDQFIKNEKEVKDLINLMNVTSSDEIIMKVLKFLIIYHKNSFSLELFENFSLFMEKNQYLIEKLYNLFENSKLESLSLFICLLFLCISIINEVWENLKLVIIN